VAQPLACSYLCCVLPHLTHLVDEDDVLKMLVNPCLGGVSSLPSRNNPTGQTIHCIEAVVKENHCHMHRDQPNVSSMPEHNINMRHPTSLSILASKPRCIKQDHQGSNKD
jgi:hypothetical protein